MYKKDGWYYLMIAEGGTEYGHMVTMARSRNVWGPFESCPHNPILSHRDDCCSPFQAVGHADITADEDGNWWMVAHAIRPSFAQLHHIGRETMLMPMVWNEDGWPVVNGGKSLTSTMTGPGDGNQNRPRQWRDSFEDETFAPRWAWIRNPDWNCYQLTDRGLILKGSETTMNDIDTCTFLGVRQQALDIRYETQMQLRKYGGCAGITIFHTAEHHYDLCVRKQEGGLAVWLRRRVADILVESQPVFLADTDTAVLQICANRNLYTFLAGAPSGEPVTVGTGRTQLLSTEAMPCTFTGCFAGMFAEGASEAEFRYFSTEEA